MIDDNMWKYKQFQNPISSQSMSKLANISSSSSSSSNEINNRRKLSSWPIVILLILPFLLFIILHDYNDSGIGYYSNNNNNGVHSNLDIINSNSNGDPSNSNNNDNDNNPSSFIQQKQQSNDCICDINNSSNNNMNSQITKQQQQRIPFIPGEPVYDSDRTIIFLITPTYTRPTQMADMTRLSQTLQLVPDIFWIVVEDAHNKSKSVEDLLRRSNIPYVQLLGPRPATHLDKRSGRGVSNRLRAFEWLRENYSNTTQNGVIYFADDDNAYDIRIFDEMRSTRIVSMFPVGLISTLGLSTPIVSRKSGKIIGFHDPFIGRRKFAVDMAGFAVNLQFFLKQKKSTMPYKVGYEEDYFLKSLGVQVWQLEPKAKNCTEILVWHTKTKPSDKPKLSLMKKIINYNETYLPDLYANQLEQT